MVELPTNIYLGFLDVLPFSVVYQSTLSPLNHTPKYKEIAQSIIVDIERG
jgi:hypothetical protein